MKQLILNTIQQMIQDSGLSYYRAPLLGAAPATDGYFAELQKVVGPKHLLPEDLLPGAVSVIAFFLPFKLDVVRGNRNERLASREWAQVYIETNGLIDLICTRLQLVLAGQDVKLAFFPPTYVFDTELLVSAWSHKHIAYRCGLGQFGRNQLLVTPKGCAGRLGSAVLDVKLDYDTPLTPQSYCQASGCHYCSSVCPVQAIAGETFNRQACYRQCQWNDVHYSDLESCEVCGKCATGPCAYLENNSCIQQLKEEL